MGSTTYYQAVMRADELVANVRPAHEIFEEELAAERMQRDLSEERVEKMIVPYLAKTADRFFGSLIVLVREPDVFNFEPLDELGIPKLRGAYRVMCENTGALTIAGGKLFALDGQHRLHALRTIINHVTTPRLKLRIEAPYRNDIKRDMLSVIFLEFETEEKARRIFNKVNRYAKPTSRAVNILMSEDDGLSIVARTLAVVDEPENFGSAESSPIPHKLRNDKVAVALDKTSLSGNDFQLTTIELIQKSVRIIAEHTGGWNLDESKTIVRPGDDVLKDAYETCVEWWQALVETFEPFVDALDEPDQIPEMRKTDSDYSVAMRPAGQEAIMLGLLKAHKLTTLSAETLVTRLNSITMSLTDQLWAGVLLGGGGERRRMITTNQQLAGELLMYMLVGHTKFGASRRSNLETKINFARQQFGYRAKDLPNPVA